MADINVDEVLKKLSMSEKVDLLAGKSMMTPFMKCIAIAIDTT